MGFDKRVTLGRTGLSVGPLAVSGGYGVDASSLREAFDRGVNYWYHGSFRRPAMTEAVRALVAAGKRDELVLTLQSYTRWAWFLEKSVERGLRALNTDHADVLLLGWFNRAPSERLMERVERLRARGLFRFVAVSSHERSLFPKLAADPRIDLLHVRYNAAHDGAERDVFPLMAPGPRPGIVAYTATSWGQLLDPTRMPAGEAPLRARDCYRFVLSNPDFNVCMTGPADGAQMREALAALDEGPLSADEMARARRIGAAVHSGARGGR
jgi:aryl-alcohol dehydrogenase-like predicted oxidoreductase